MWEIEQSLKTCGFYFQDIFLSMTEYMLRFHHKRSEQAWQCYPLFASFFVMTPKSLGIISNLRLLLILLTLVHEKTGCTELLLPTLAIVTCFSSTCISIHDTIIQNVSDPLLCSTLKTFELEFWFQLHFSTLRIYRWLARHVAYSKFLRSFHFPLGNPPPTGGSAASQ